ncbi:hypothetical protein AYI69_g7846 [Smittium culicis]|uniref:Endonuclease/exonuclease/phosphatase domain-containing protein n=1 Tax=Smittium culicis TaxID=133412 RepID=A0A1R1XP57_9FUNG|nr:hypothetical protein AYI69_g7846 [Smittium culicis]
MMSKVFPENDIKKTDPTSVPELESHTENPTARTEEYFIMGYWNCQELSDRKWDRAIAAVKEAKLDILFLAHEQDEIVCLVTQDVRKQISSTCVTRYTISMKINGHYIMAVYFPLSMKPHKISESISDSELYFLIGDINTFFGARDMSANKSMKHLFPETLGPTPDHAFDNQFLVANYSFSSLCNELSDLKLYLLV